MATVLGVVLCGGASSRMGRDKAKIELASGMNFLEHAVERLKPVCDEVCLAGRSHWNDSLVALPDPTPNRGPIFGVLEAIRYAMQRHHACLITPVDMPHLTCHDLQKLVSGWQTDDRLTYAVSQPETVLSAHSKPSLDAQLQSTASCKQTTRKAWVDLRVRTPPWVDLGVRSSHPSS